MTRDNPTQALAAPNATRITLLPNETRRLATLTADLLDKENAMRARAAHYGSDRLPPVVREYFATAVRVRKALTGLISQ